MKRMHRGAYIARYYPERLEKFAKMVSALVGMRRNCLLTKWCHVQGNIVLITLPNLTGDTWLSNRA